MARKFTQNDLSDLTNASNSYIDENGAFDISKCDLIAYANGGYYRLDKKIGKFGFSVQKNKKKQEKITKNIDL